MHATRALLTAGLLLAIVATSGLAAAQEARVLASTYRVDLGSLAPGEVRHGEILLSNPGYEPTTIRLAHEGEPALVETPAEVIVPPGDPYSLGYHVRVPDDAAPGFHGEALKLVPRAVTAAVGVGTMDAGTAIVFTWRTTAIGVSAIESPELAIPGENITGALVLVSTWQHAANATVRLEWRDPTGALVRATDLGPTLLEPNATARLDYDLAPIEAMPGAQTLRARVVDAGAAPIGGPTEQTFHLGRREAIFSLGSLEDLLDGNASVTIHLENTGDVPTSVVPRVKVRDANGVEREILLAAVLLAPGERREVTATIPLPPGRFSFGVEAEGAEHAIGSAAAGDAPLELTMRAPSDPERAIRIATTLGAIALVVSAIAAIAVLLWRRRGAIGAALARVRLPRRPRAPASAPAPAQAHDDFDALFVKLDTEHAAHEPRLAVGAALLVDVDSLGGRGGGLPRLYDLAGGRPVDVAYAYARAGSGPGAEDVARALTNLGFVARVLVEADDFRIEMTLDASREARAGRVILLASSDPAFLRLAHALEAEGARVELLGPPSRRVPVYSSNFAATRPST